MTATAPSTYLRTKVLTAAPAELRLMLLDGAIRFLRRAHEGLERKDYEQVYFGITRCQSILMELLNALRPDHDPDLCKKLSGLYTFMYLRLVEASSNRDPAIAQEVLDLLEYERETWVMLMERLNEGAGTVMEGEGVSVHG